MNVRMDGLRSAMQTRGIVRCRATIAGSITSPGFSLFIAPPLHFFAGISFTGAWVPKREISRSPRANVETPSTPA
jgi:hypothetical protein